MQEVQQPKTPSMTMRVQPGVAEEDVLAFCKRASRLTLSQIVDKVEVNEQLASTRRRQFTVNISFYPKDEYREEYDVEPSEVLASFNTKFPQILKKEIQMELKKLQADLKALSDVGRGRAETYAGGAGEEDGDANAAAVDDNMSEVGDGDADDEKRARQSKQQATYDSDSDDEDAPPKEFDDAALEAEYAEIGSNVGLEKSDNAMDVDDFLDSSSRVLEEQSIAVRKNFFSNLKMATIFNFTDGGVRFELEVSYLVPFAFWKHVAYTFIVRV